MARGASRKPQRGASRKRSQQRSTRRWVPLAWRRVARGLLAGSVLMMALAVLGWGGWQLLSMPVERIVVSSDLKRVSQDQLMSVVTETSFSNPLAQLSKEWVPMVSNSMKAVTVMSGSRPR